MNYFYFINQAGTLSLCNISGQLYEEEKGKPKNMLNDL
jgi:hypothetical protein